MLYPSTRGVKTLGDRPEMNEGWFPLSFMQRIFWFLDQFGPNTPAHKLPRALKITGELDISALHEAFRTLLRRHDVLRTGFFSSLEGEPFQCVLDDVDIDLTIRDLSSLDASERELEAATIASEEARKIFDLERPPSFVSHCSASVPASTCSYW